MGGAIDTSELRRLRLRSQQIDAPGLRSLTDVVGNSLATQAQDFGNARWAVGLRSPGAGVSDVDAALAAGSIVRSWPMRGTLFFVEPADLRWMLQLTAPRTIARMATRHRQLGLEDSTISRVRDLVVSALSGGRSLDRAGFMKLLEAHGIDSTEQRGYHLIWLLAQEALICWGPPSGTQQALVLLDEWAPATEPIDRDTSLHRFALRYFTGHGPATVKDFAWWAGITLGDARRGLELASAELVEVEHDGMPHWMAAGADAAASGSVHLLPGFDEWVLGYTERSPIMSKDYFARIVPGGNGIFQPTIVIDGRVVGTWRRGSAKTGLTRELFEPVSAHEALAIDRAAEAYAAFAAGEAS